MALNSNALATLASAKSFLGITAVDYDTEIERMINVTSQNIEGECRRVLVTATHTEYHDGRRSNLLQPRNWPITGGGSTNGKPEVFFDDGDGDFPASTAIEDSEYWSHELDTQLLRVGANWPLGTRNIKIVYIAGLGVAGTMPSDLEDACLQYVGWMYRINNDRRMGVESKTKAGETVRYTKSVPPFIMDLIQPYIKQEFPVSTHPVRNG